MKKGCKKLSTKAWPWTFNFIHSTKLHTMTQYFFSFSSFVKV
jgi:hypothetical protein